VNQEFTLSAESFLAGLDEMLGGLDRVAAAINDVADSAARLSGVTASTAEADTGLADAIGQLLTAIDDQTVATNELAASQDRAIGSVDALSASLDAQVGSADAAAAATGKADASTGLLGTHGKTAFLAIAAGMAYSVVEAAKFQAEVTRLYTAAGLVGVRAQKVSQDLLQLGDRAGYSGTQMAEAMYHPISAGLSYAAALRVVAYSAELARIHGANLEDTTYALSSVMKAYDVSAGGVAKTSALLNAIVGQGDMRFQDFVESIKNWTPTGAAMGISIQSMGAAIAYLTDRGNSAEVASTRLTMGLSMVTSGSKAANTYLSALGLTTGTLTLRNKTLQEVMLSAGLTTNKIAADLRRPDGIYVALTQIQDAFRKAGLSASQADEVMAKIFGGGRSDKAMLSLMSNLPNLRAKYEDIGRAVGDYGKSWEKTQATVAQQWHEALAGIQNLAISFGQILLPAVTKVLSVLARLFAYIQANPVLRILAGLILSLAVAMGVAATATAALSVAMDANPVMLVVLAVIALIAGLYELYKHCALVRRIVADVAHFFAGVWRDAVRLAGDVVHWFVTGPLAWIKAQLAVFAAFWKAHGAEIMKIAKAVWDFVAVAIQADWDIIKTVVRVAAALVVGVVKAAWDVVWGVTKMAWNLVATVISTTIRVILDIVGAVLDIIQGKWSQAGRELSNATSAIWHGIVHIIENIASGFGTILIQAGNALVRGLIGGIKSALGGLWSTITGIGHGIASAFSSVMHIFSPSKVMERLGLLVGEGIIVGLEGTASQVRSAAGKLATAVKDALTAGLITDRTAVTLTNWIERDNLRLQADATRRAAILKTIATAEKYATSTASSVTSWAGLSNVVSGMPSGSVITSQGLEAGLQADLAKIQKFNADIRRLSRLGLNRNLLNQIIQAGPDSGMQIAEALLNGPVSEIGQLNKTETQITAGATALGQQAANAMYDSGKYAGQGFLSGLEHQQKAIEALMARIAKAMVDRIRRELGIHSESTVAHWHGLMFAQGLASGMDAGRPLVDAAAKRLAGAAGFALAGRSGAAAGSGGTVTIENHYHVGPFNLASGFALANDAHLLTMLEPVVQKAVLQLEQRNPTSQTTTRAGRR